MYDKVIGEKKSVEIENIFKAIDTEEKIRELLDKNYRVQEEKIDNIVKSLNEENKFEILRRNLPNKSESEIKNIIEQVNRIKADVGKVLLLGSAGIGKTTLMHYLSYKWGKEDLWNDKFDYVFRIKLKELLNESWKDGYSGYFDINNLSQSKLNCFIHYCLGDSESTLSVKEIMDIQNKDKVLLLLDGYDEVAHLNILDEFKKLIDKILEYKNVIMSSRPNAITEKVSNEFERIVENTGWDSEGIEQYVNKNFEYDKELGVQLKSFLNTHSQIKEICEVPINTALICLVWSDKDIRDKFQKNNNEDFNISQLYQEVVIWLGKKYFQKFENKRIVNITDEQILYTPEFQFLQEIAFEALVATGKLVTHQLIKAKLNDKDFTILNIEKINKLGLLRAEGTGESIINLNHQFIHLTFQEYLAACYLKNQLENEEDKSKAANFIGEHRNDPKYLMTLKFLAGIVNNDNNQELIEIFWEAATCNVDGILELGIERKIILLMHLLAQSKINEKFDNRIPNLTQIQELIDEVVLKDITNWEQHIIDSGYLSEEIVKTVNEKLRNKKATPQELKASVGIIAALANRNEWGSKTQIYTKLTNSLRVEDIQLQKIILQKLAQILNGTIDEVVVRESLSRILPLNTWALNEYVNIILAKIIATIPNLSKEVLNRIQKIDDTKLLSDSLDKVVKAMPNQQALTFLERTITNSNIECRIKCKAIEMMTNVLNIRSDLAYEIFSFLKERFTNSEHAVNCTIINSLVIIAKVMPNLVEKAFIFLKEIIKNPKENYETKSEAIKSIVEIVKMQSNLTEEAFTFLKEIITNHSTEYDVNYAATQSLTEIVKMQSSLVEEAFIFLKEIVTNPSYNFKRIAIGMMVEMIEVRPSLAEKAFTFLKEVITNPNYNVQYTATETIAEMVEVVPNLAEEAFTFLKEIIINSNYDVDFEAGANIVKIVKVKPTYEAFILLKALIISFNVDDYNKYAATAYFTKVFTVW